MNLELPTFHHRLHQGKVAGTLRTIPPWGTVVYRCPLGAGADIFDLLSEVMKVKMPNMTNHAAYPSFLFSGMAAWGLFNEIIMRSINVFAEQAAALKKISFPWLTGR